MPERRQDIERRWEYFANTSGSSPVEEFLDSLATFERAQIKVRMEGVRTGVRRGRKLQGDIWEIKAPVGNMEYRILYASVGTRGAILLAVEAFMKKSTKTPPGKITIAQKRLREWLARQQ